MRILPLARRRERAVLRPHTERQRKRPHAISRHRGINRQRAARNLLLYHRVAVLPEVGVPERVPAQLEPLLREETKLPEAPLGLLPLDPFLAEKRMPGGAARQYAERRPVPPVRMLLVECEPDADGAVRIDLECSVVIDVAELRRTRVIEGEYHRRLPRGQIDLLVDHLSDGHRAIAARVQPLEVTPKVIALYVPPAVAVAE